LVCGVGAFGDSFVGAGAFAARPGSLLGLLLGSFLGSLLCFAGFRAVDAAAVLFGAALFLSDVTALGAAAVRRVFFFGFGVGLAAFLEAFAVALLAAAFDVFDAEARAVLAVFFFGADLAVRFPPAAAARFAFFALLVFFFVRVAMAGFLWLGRTTVSRRQRR
jgi:hypothetical protein